jgi:uncharacterized protein YyaL (SSP411 family)
VNTSPSPHTNRLAKEKSPYLLQHQHNPVDWYAWGEEAFAKARREQKPIFLSIGYSTCLWCHVMAHESFENVEIEKLMNDNFVAINVDREERPDVDRVYMTYVQATTGGGGWPMTVFLTPDLQPFYGGTYFPPEDKFGRPGFPTVLKRLAEAWRDDRENITKTAKSAIEQLRELTAGGPAKGSAGKAEIMTAFNSLARVFDDEWGGFGNAPKFPHPVSLNLLFRVYAREGAASRDGKVALGMALETLDKMAAGGMHDHLGGGFHRYSVDRFWHIPHFEKMLYDQAQLVCSYLDAYQVTHEERHAAVARDVLDYVLRDMTDKGGGFYSAEDADSIIAHGKPEHAEGAFYVWTKAEIDAALGTERAAIFDRYYGVEENGNAPKGSDPQGEFVGKNTLIVRMSLADAAKAAEQSEEAFAATLAKCRAELLALRSKRPRPHLDDKIITAWNGLMISAFAKAGQILGEPKYVTAAQRSAQFLKAQLWKDGRLIRNYRGEASKIAGFADDYASLIQGLLDLYEADFDVAWLRWAEELQQAMDTQFWDAEHGGYFSGEAGAADILLRMKEDYDGAEPSPNSVAALNLQRLSQIVGSEELKAKADKTMAAFAQRLAESPTAMPQMLCAVDSTLAKPRQIVIAGTPTGADTQTLLKEVHRHFLPGKLLLLASGGDAQAWLGQHMEFLGSVQPIGGKAAAYVCENFACQLPTADPKKLGELLSK